MDNRVFNVNGSGDEMLLKALELVFLQDSENCKCTGWFETKENGLVLCWSSSSKNINPIPGKMTAKDCIPFVKSWLDSEFSAEVNLSDWCGNCDHDGHNSIGWQVYCEDWGHVANEFSAICGIKPAYMWHGK